MEFCLWKELCLSSTQFEKEERGKVLFRLDENEAKIDFVDKKRTLVVFVKYEGNLFQYATLVADIDRKKLRNAVRKTCIERINISLLQDEIRKQF